MKKRHIFLGSVLILGMAASLEAGGDLQAPPAYVDHWSGPYIGVAVGYRWADADMRGSDNLNNHGQVLGLSPDGVDGGFFAGYNALMQDGWLWGIEGALNFNSGDDQKHDPSLNPLYDYKVKMPWEMALTGRVGRVLDDRYLPYLLGGVTMGKVKSLWAYKGVGPSPWEYWAGDTVLGWTVGAGLEVRWDNGIHARIQYRYSDYGSADLTHADGLGDYTYEKVDVHTHALQLGISYRF